MVFDTESLNPAPPNEIILFYKAFIYPKLVLYPNYKIKRFVYKKTDKKIIAAQLENGIYIPASHTSRENLELVVKEGYPIQEVETFEWEIDDEISAPCDDDKDITRISSLEQVNELYQYFRMTFANWLPTQKAGLTTRENIQKIIFSKTIYDFEKRKRLEILLGSEFQKWLYPDASSWEMPQLFMRKDCRVLSKDGCNGACIWREDVPEGEPKCRLHIDKELKVNEKIIDTTRLFTRKLIDELVRFPKKRNQLFTKKIPALSGVIEPIQSGNQLIIPESSPRWFDLLQMEWLIKTPETPLFYEEMHQYIDDKNVVYETNLPDNLLKLFGGKSKLSLNYLTNKAIPLSVFSFVGVDTEDLEINDDTSMLTEDDIDKLVKLNDKIYGIINVRKDTPEIYFAKPSPSKSTDAIILVFLPDNKYALLIETPGNKYVNVNKLSGDVLEAYDNATIIMKDIPAPVSKSVVPAPAAKPVSQAPKPVPSRAFVIESNNEDSASVKVAPAPKPAAPAPKPVVQVAKSILPPPKQESAETSSAETSNSETSSAETSNSETSSAETSNSEASSAETSSAETSNSETSSAETSNSEASSAETSNSEASSAEASSAETNDLLSESMKKLNILNASKTRPLRISNKAPAAPAKPAVAPAKPAAESVLNEVPFELPQISTLTITNYEKPPVPSAKASVPAPAQAPVPSAKASAPVQSAKASAPAQAHVPSAKVPSAKAPVPSAKAPVPSAKVPSAKASVPAPAPLPAPSAKASAPAPSAKASAPAPSAKASVPAPSAPANDDNNNLQFGDF
jgi:hypothetical protein